MHRSMLHPNTRSAITSASFSALERTRYNPAGFVSALAHEIRNPLCNINLALEMLHTMNIEEEQRQYFSIIGRGSGRINDLISRLLTLDPSEETHCEIYSIRQMLEDVLEIVSDRLLLKSISVAREYSAADQRVFMDAEKVKIAITNIVINAIDAMSPKTGELRLVTRSTDELSFVEIHDNGIGISEENLQRIFEPYFSDKPGGMGIGLSASLAILRANHAGLDVTSREGAGSCFTLSFDGR